MNLLINIPLLFDISGGEFLIVILFALIFFGSKNIPDLMRGLGRGYREFKSAANSIKDEISKTTDGVEKDLDVRGPLDQQFNEIEEEIKKDLNPLDDSKPRKKPGSEKE